MGRRSVSAIDEAYHGPVEIESLPTRKRVETVHHSLKGLWQHSELEKRAATGEAAQEDDRVSRPFLTGVEGEALRPQRFANFYSCLKSPNGPLGRVRAQSGVAAPAPVSSQTTARTKGQALVNAPRKPVQSANTTRGCARAGQRI